jgi:hypothetical protein
MSEYQVLADLGFLLFRHSDSSDHGINGHLTVPLSNACKHGDLVDAFLTE